MSAVKEPHYFAFADERMNYRGPGVTINSTSVTDLKDYEQLFAGVTHESAIGEASALYLYVPVAARRICDYAPEMKLITILRHPAERAFSAFMHLRRDGREPLADFRAALQAEPERIRDNWGFLWRYTALGFYAQQLKLYYQLFPPEQIRVFLYDDFRENPLGVLREAYGFLAVEDNFTPDMSLRPKVSGVPRSRRLHDFLRGNNPAKAWAKGFLPISWREKAKQRLTNRNLVKQEFPQELKSELTEVFREDIQELQGMLKRDLTAWLT
jgi:hypothetical protein